MQSTIYDRLYARAKGEMSVEEIPGKENNPRILEYAAMTSLKAKDDETPWCASFACWVLEKEGVKSSRSAAAFSFASWGAKLQAGIKGCLVVLKRDGGFHVGFYDHEDEQNIYLLGGNQGNRVSIAAFPKWRLVDFRGCV